MSEQPAASIESLSKNLRQSHFTLGNFPKSQYKSIMQRDYPPYDINPSGSVGKELNLKASHFELGNYSAKNLYATTNLCKYPPHFGFHPEKLNEEKKNDLRTHHFNLGKANPTTVSYSRIAFPKREIPLNLKDEQDFQRNKMRRHHHNFEETKQKMMTTHYNSEYNRDYPKDSLMQGASKEELMKKVVELRNSHIIFGKENVPYKTVQHSSYNEKPIDPFERVQNKEITKTNFILGDYKPDYQTLNQQFFVEQPYSKNTIAEETKRELRETHFVLGADKNNYNSVHTATYQKPLLAANEMKNMSPFLYQNHFSLGDPNLQTNYKSTYTLNSKPHEITKGMQSRDQKNDRSSNFKIGQQKVDFKSEAQSKYTNPGKVAAAELDEKLKSDLRSSHFRFDDVKKNNFATVTQISYQEQKGSVPSIMDENARRNLRNTHYSLGKDGGKYSTEYYTKYTKKDQPNTVNMRELSNQLRATHFKLG